MWLVIGNIWRPLLEVLVLWVVYYRLLKLLHRTRAMQVLLALIALMAVFFLTQVLGLVRLHWVFNKVFALSLVSCVIIFHPELRRGLARLVEGHEWWSPALVEERVIDEIIKAVGTFAAKRTGALIVLEREVSLSPYVESGVALDSPVSAELLQTVFTAGAPLHDGAVIIRGGKIAAAGCLLPLSLNPRLAKKFGTRHRAAMGLTEETDAVVLVVSEETGAVSASIGGRLTRELEPAELRELLEQAQTSQPQEILKHVQVVG